jgi:hypothetical protein
MTTDRLSLALPTDVPRDAFDITVTQPQIDADTFLNTSDDTEALTGWVAAAEDELRQQTNDNMRISRAGVAGRRETYEQQTYRLPGHQQYRARFSTYTFDYDYDEKTIPLDNGRVLPFDSGEGDEIYAYRGLGDGTQWENITDEQGDAWDILDNVSGGLVVHPSELYEVMFGRVAGGVPFAGVGMDRLRVAISYRYGGLGGSLSRTAQTTLDTSLTTSDTGPTAVADGSRLPTAGVGGTIVMKIGGEYLEVDPDPAGDSIDINARGVRGTTAASHNAGDRVVYTPPAIRKAVAARAGMTLIGSSQYRSWLPDADAELDELDLLNELRGTWEGTIAALS